MQNNTYTDLVVRGHVGGLAGACVELGAHGVGHVVHLALGVAVGHDHQDAVAALLELLHH